MKKNILFALLFITASFNICAMEESESELWELEKSDRDILLEKLWQAETESEYNEIFNQLFRLMPIDQPMWVLPTWEAVQKARKLKENK